MLLKEIRFAIRTLWAAPGVTLAAVLSLALGIGINAAMFSGADALLLHPMPVPHGGEIVAVSSSGPDIAKATGGVSYADYLDLCVWNRSLEGLIAFQYRRVAVDAQPRQAMAVSANFFRTLEITPAAGRDFRSADERLPVAIVSYAAWQNQFGFDPKIIGRVIRLNEINFQIVGVAQETFRGIDTFLHPDYYFLIGMLPQVAGLEPNVLTERANRWFSVRGRMKHAMRLEETAAEFAALGARLAATYPAADKDYGLVARTEMGLHAVQAPQHVALSVMMLGISSLVLLLACANVANLLLGRARSRTHEMAVRLAMGASRRRLMSQLLLESGLLALAGALLSLAFADMGVEYFRRAISFSNEFPVYIDFQLNGRVLLFSFFAATASVLIFGLTPAFHTTRVDLVPALKASEAKGTARQGWLRSALVVSQVALALMLLTGEALFIRAFGELAMGGAGFRTDHALILRFDPGLIHSTKEQTETFYQKLLEQVRRAPGVKNAALAGMVPIEFFPPNQKFKAGGDEDYALTFPVSDRFFETMGTPILHGRGVLPSDTAQSARVAVINDVMAARHWPGRNPVGQRFQLDGANGPWVEVIGVAESTWYAHVGEDRTPFMYVPLTQQPWVSRSLVIETSGADASPWMAPIRNLVRSIDPNQPVYNVRTMRDFYEHTGSGLQTIRLVVRIVGGMGLLGLSLAVIGVHALVSYSVSQRTREIGIRMAIGADSRRILGLILGHGLSLSIMGLVFGLAGSVALARGIRALFPRIMEHPLFTPWIFMTLPVGLLCLTLLAGYLPARRAAAIDPNAALREE